MVAFCQRKFPLQRKNHHPDYSRKGEIRRARMKQPDMQKRNAERRIDRSLGAPIACTINCTRSHSEAWHGNLGQLFLSPGVGKKRRGIMLVRSGGDQHKWRAV